METGSRAAGEKKMIRFRYIYRHICSVIMILVAVSMFLYAWLDYVFGHSHTGHLIGRGSIILSSILYMILFYVIGNFLHIFRIGIERIAKQTAGMIMTLIITDLTEILISAAIINDFGSILDFTWRYALLCICQSVFMAVLMFFMFSLYKRLIKPIPVTMIYGEYGNDLELKMNLIPQNYQVETSIHYDDPSLDLPSLIEKSVSVLIYDVPAEFEHTVIKLCFEKDRRLYAVPKIADIILKSSENINVMDTPLYLNRNLEMSLPHRIAKRFIDSVLSILGLIVLSPLFLVIAIAVKAEDKGPVFFTQERVTRKGKHFRIIKFRSMIVDAEKDGSPRAAGMKDERITKVGKVIRKYRMDELPQFINIIAGDMSIVGPRPERIENVEMYTRDIPEFIYRQKVKAGLTGFAQVYGKYNTTALDKLKLDLMYITNYSLILDLQIIFETVKILFQKDSSEGFPDGDAGNGG